MAAPVQTRALWAEGGIGPARLAVMDRVTLPKTAILGRTGDRAAGVAFVAATGDCAMLHALEVDDPLAVRLPGAAESLRQGLASGLARQGAAS